MPNSNGIRPPSLASVVGVGFALWGFSIGLGRLSDNSLFTHIATGRLILDSGIPKSDPYSFTATGTPWVVQSWLASTIYALVEVVGGVAGIRILMGVLTAALVWLVWLLTDKARSLIPRVIILGLVVAVGTTVWSPRPLLFGLIFCAITLLALDGRLSPWLLLPVMSLWVNIHGSFPLGIALILAVLAGTHLDKEDVTTELRCLRWALGGVLIGAVNPLGPILILFPVKLISRQEMLGHIVEWQSPSFSTVWGRLFLLQTVIAIALLARKPSFRTAIPLTIFLAAALLGSRNVALASIVLVPGMANGFNGIGVLDGHERGKGVVAALGSLMVAGLLLARSTLMVPGYDFAEFPVDATSFISQTGWHSPEVRIASQETVGNYLTLVYGKDARVFFDDRVDMYPEPVMDDFMALYRGQSAWRGVLEENGVDVIIWDSSANLSLLLREDPSWRVVYDDQRWIVACDRRSEVLADAHKAGGQSC